VPTPRLFEPGELFAGYEVVGRLGQGGMAVVYEVRRRRVAGFSKRLALKVLSPHLQHDPALVALFFDEARIAAQVEHPNVVHVFDVGEYEGAPYLVMEYLRGCTLAEIAERKGPPHDRGSLAIYLDILARAAAGLAGAHAARDEHGAPLGIVHRDFGAHNLHVGYDGRVKVLDFGIAQAHGRVTQTEAGDLRGTLAVLAPERISRSYEVTSAADAWAWGVTAHEVLRGLPLFRGPDTATTLWNILHVEAPALDVPELPRAVGELIAACLSKDPRARPASCAEIATHVAGAARQLEEVDDARIAAWLEPLSSEATETARAASSEPRRPASTTPLTAAPAARRPAQRSWRAWLVLAALGAALLYARFGREPARAGDAGEDARASPPVTSTPALMSAPHDPGVPLSESDQGPAPLAAPRADGGGRLPTRARRQPGAVSEPRPTTDAAGPLLQNPY
jgi:serine/threonine-protein kinase